MLMLMCASSLCVEPNLEVLPVSDLEVGGDDKAREEEAVVVECVMLDVTRTSPAQSPGP